MIGIVMVVAATLLLIGCGRPESHVARNENRRRR
jgi:hypothetical protein